MGSTPSQAECCADGHPLPIDEDVVEGIDQRIRSRRTCAVCDRTSQVNSFLSKERRRRVGHGIGLVDRGLNGQLEDELMAWLVRTEIPASLDCLAELRLELDFPLRRESGSE